MTTKDYCYNLKGIKNDEPSIKPVIIKHLEKLFQNKKKFGESAFDSTEKLPIDIGISLVWKNYKQVCLDIKSKSQISKKRIRKILKMMKDDDLIIDKEKGISLQKPEIVCDVKEYDGKQRWTTLEHNGPYFKHLFEPSTERLNVNLIYDGKEYPLNAKEEEVASFYAKRIITEEKSTKKYLSMKEFNDNFFNDFKTYLTTEHKKIFKDFKKFNFSLLVNRIKQIKQEKEEEKKLRREQKEKEKKNEKEEKMKKDERITKLEKKLNYSFAFVDGIKKDIRNSAVEMPGLYVGAGNVMKYKGKIKPLYYPEDVIINASKGKAPLPPKGHKWGGIVTDNEANWISNYKDKITGKRKYIFLTETRDLLKFEKARKLNKYINVVNKQINDLLHNKNKKEKQIGCALYLIKEYGIRVGNECEEEDDSCDTKEKVVGATTLMVQNVNCVENEDDKFFIDLSFKGKDSVSYDNTLEVSEDVYKNIKSFIKGKSDDSKVFDLITSNDVNKYLKSIDKDFSAKVFRTRLASSIMYEGLKKTSYTKKDTDDKKIADFNEINRLVAIKLNHKKGLTEAVKEKLMKDKEDIDKKKKEMKQEKDPKKKEKMKHDIKIKESKLLEKDKSKEIALDTSKKNYIDPRIIKAWAERVNLGGCKDEEEDEEEEEEEEEDDEEKVVKHCVDKVYTTAHLKHFKWAIEDEKFDEDWDYEDTELDCSVGVDLKPEEALEIKLIKKMDVNSDHVQKCIKKVAKKFNKPKNEVIKVFNELKL